MAMDDDIRINIGKRTVAQKSEALRVQTKRTFDSFENQGGQNTSSGSSREKRNRPSEKVIADKDYTSSIFTFNPELPKLPKKASKDLAAESTQPSNGPTSKGISSIQLHPRLERLLGRYMNLTGFTDIQSLVIPHLVSTDHRNATSTPQDILIRSETGSGKTLAYLIPIIHQLMTEHLNRTSGLFAIVLAPTRELARQIHDVCHPICHPLVATLLVGGEKRSSEKARIRKGANMIIATPGRFLDHIQATECLNLSQVRWLVLDEGDRLVDMGFEETLRSIVEQLDRQCRQARLNMLCSATLTEEVKKISHLTLTNPIVLQSEQTDAQADADAPHVPSQLSQMAVVIPLKIRLAALFSLLSTCKTKAVVFVSCSAAVEWLCAVFSALVDNVECIRLHGSLEQPERVQQMKRFRKRALKPTIMFATDVMGRGIDLRDLELVVQYDAPFSTDDYIHRVGRTARAGLRGRAVLFLLPNEAKYIKVLEAAQGLDCLPSISYEALLSQALGTRWMEQAAKWQLQVETWCLDKAHTQNMKMSRSAYQDHMRAYTTHISAEKQYFNLRDIHLGHLAKSFGLRDTPHVNAIKVSGNIKDDEATRVKKQIPSMFSRASKMTERASLVDESVEKKYFHLNCAEKFEPTNGLRARLLLTTAALDRKATSILSALHARLSLSPLYPLATLNRALTDPSHLPDHKLNNYPLQVLGKSLGGYYVSEFLITKYPRLPNNILKAAVWGYLGPVSKANIAREWGITTWDADAYGRGDSQEDGKLKYKGVGLSAPFDWRSKRLKRNELKSPEDMLGAKLEVQEMAMCHAVEAILGGVHVHNGVEEARKFIYTHFLGRHLDMAALFRFKFPEREVSRLCDRLKLHSPVSRIIAETGRASVAPVYVVGVYSGRDKLGEGQGSSLAEAKFRASANALRAWYLYQTLDVILPSSTDQNPTMRYEAALVDPGSVIL